MKGDLKNNTFRSAKQGITRRQKTIARREQPQQNNQPDDRRGFNKNNNNNTRNNNVNNNFSSSSSTRAGSTSSSSFKGRRASSVSSNRSLGVSSSTSSAGFNTPGLNLSFGNFEFREIFNSQEGKKGGGIRKLYIDLSRAKKERARMDVALQTEEGLEERRGNLIGKAISRMGGEKIRDDATYLSRKLQKRRSKKRKSAKEWAKRKDDLQKSVDEAVERHGSAGKSQMMAANRKRRLAMEHNKTSAGRKDAVKRTERNAKRGKTVKPGKKFGGGGSSSGRGGGGGRGGRGGGGRGRGGGGGRGRGGRGR
jgi:hypothetical protein